MARIDGFGSVAKPRHSALLLAFAGIVMIKALLSLKFQSPWIFQDEMVYAKIAEDIFSSDHLEGPPLYPLSLSIAYLFSADKSVVYHVMLFINCIINSSIIFPSYFILERYCSKDYALGGALVIATLPSLVLYSFALMAENLFIPLFIFSIWFLLEARRTRGAFWGAAAVGSVALLFFTKHAGIFIAFGLVVSAIYYIFFGSRQDGLRPPLERSISARSMALLIALASIASLMLHNIFRDNPALRGYLDWETRQIWIYAREILQISADASSQRVFASLFLNEMEYLMLSTYFVLFFIAVAFTVSMFNMPKGLLPEVPGWRSSNEPKMEEALRSSIIYFLFSSLATVMAVVVYMYRALRTLPEGYSHLLLSFREDFELIGRYIDPLVPAIFLFALIGLYRMHRPKKGIDLRTTFIFIMSYIIITVLFALSFPYHAERTADLLPLTYLRYLKALLPAWAIVAVIMPVFLAGFYLYLYDKKYRPVLLATMVLFSAITSAYTFQIELNSSKEYQSQNQIGSYLERFSNDSSLILMDLQDDRRDRVMLPFTRFWAEGRVITYNTAEDPSGVYTDYAKNVSYIITSKILPYEPVAFSTRGYLLYKPTNVKDDGSLFGFDRTQGWQSMELWNGSPVSWMTGDATLTIYSERDLPATLSFSVQSFHQFRTLQAFCGGALLTQTIVPTSTVPASMPIELLRGMNSVRFHVPEGCGRPIDIPELNNSDGRCLGVAIGDLSIQERGGNGSAQIAHSYPKFVSGWHGSESWNGTPTRWMEEEAAIIVYSEENRTAELSFQALSFNGPRSLQLSAGGAAGITYNVTPNFATLRLPVNLTKGETLIKLRTPQGCRRPCELPAQNNSDCRCLSLAVQNIDLT